MSMFCNVGSKCKTLAKVVCYGGIICSVICGALLVASGAFTYNGGGIIALYGLLVILLGSLFSWLGSLSLYAIGEAAENSAIAANLAVKADMEREQEKAAKKAEEKPEKES